MPSIENIGLLSIYVYRYYISVVVESVQPIKIGIFAKIIATSLRDGYNIRYKASKVKEILQDAKKSNKTDMDKVNDKR